MNSNQQRGSGFMGFLCTEDVAQRLGCSIRSVQRLIRQGAIRAVLIPPRIVRVHEDDLARYTAKAAALPTKRRRIAWPRRVTRKLTPTMDDHPDLVE